MMTLISMSGGSGFPQCEAVEVAGSEHAGQEDAGQAGESPALEPRDPRHHVVGVKGADPPLDRVHPAMDGSQAHGQARLERGVLLEEPEGGPGTLLLFGKQRGKGVRGDLGPIVKDLSVTPPHAPQPHCPKAKAEVDTLPSI